MTGAIDRKSVRPRGISPVLCVVLAISGFATGALADDTPFMAAWRALQAEGSEARATYEQEKRDFAEEIYRGDLQRVRRELAAGWDPSVQRVTDYSFSRSWVENRDEILDLILGAMSDPSIMSQEWSSSRFKEDPAMRRLLEKHDVPFEDRDLRFTQAAIKRGAYWVNDHPYRGNLGTVGLLVELIDRGEEKLASLLGPRTPQSERDWIRSVAGQQLRHGEITGPILERFLKSWPVKDYPQEVSSLMGIASGFGRHETVQALDSLGVSFSEEGLVRAVRAKGAAALEGLNKPAAYADVALDVLLRQEPDRFVSYWQQPNWLPGQSEEFDEFFAKVARWPDGSRVAGSERPLFLLAHGPEWLLQGLDVQVDTKGRPQPNAPDSAGRLPLHRAIEQHDPRMIQLLLFAGADIHAVDDRGESTLQLAARRGDLPLMAYLRQQGVGETLSPAENEEIAETLWAARRLETAMLTSPEGQTIALSLPTTDVSAPWRCELEFGVWTCWAREIIQVMVLSRGGGSEASLWKIGQEVFGWMPDAELDQIVFREAALASRVPTELRPGVGRRCDAAGAVRSAGRRYEIVVQGPCALEHELVELDYQISTSFHPHIHPSTSSAGRSMVALAVVVGGVLLLLIFMISSRSPREA